MMQEMLDPQDALEAAAAAALEQARAGGAACAQAVARRACTHKLVVLHGELAMLHTLQTQEVGVTVQRDGRQGAAASNQCGMAGIQGAVADALELARHAVPDPGLVLPDARQAPPATALPLLWDASLAGLDAQGLHELAQAMLEPLRRDARVAVERMEIDVACSWHVLRNSHGVAQQERRTALGWNVTATAREAGGVSGFGVERRRLLRGQGAQALAAQGCAALAGRVLGQLQPRRAPSYAGPVLLAPRAVADIVLGPLLHHLSGRSVMDASSAWGERIGQGVASPLLQLGDDMHDPGLAGATAFDREGVPTRPLALLTDGVLQAHLHSCYTARRCGTRSTASAGGPFALRMAAGATPLAQMCAARAELLVVERFSGNVDALKGDFSGVAKSSRLCLHGADSCAVGETMIAGNVLDLLRQVLAVSSGSDAVDGASSLPWLLVDGVTVSGR